jgi:hypothetical protein
MQTKLTGKPHYQNIQEEGCAIPTSRKLLCGKNEKTEA